MMFRLRLLLFILAPVFSTLTAFAQCSAWDNLVYYKNVSIRDAARDPFGNLYVVGGFYAEDLVLGSYTFTLPAGGSRAFIAKFDKDYSLLWAVSPETYSAEAMEVEIDVNNNIVVAGTYISSISFDCITLSGNNRSDVFVVSYFNNGIPSWAVGSAGADDAFSQGLTMCPNGNIVLLSSFVEKSLVTPGLTAPDISIGGVPVKTGAANQLNGGMDSFIAVIRPNGEVAWIQGIGGDGNAPDYVEDVAVDAGNNVIVTGWFSSPQISFDGHIVHKFAVSENYFLAKINPEGETLWVRETEGGINQSGWGVATDDNDNIFVAGRFYGNAKFGSFNLAGAGEADVFVVKLNASGAVLHATVIGDSRFDAGTQVEIDNHGRVLVSGYFYSDYLEIGSFSSTKSNSFDAHSFLATLNNDLTLVECAKFIKGDDSSIVWNFEVDALDNVLVITNRTFYGATIFDSETITDPDVWSVLAIAGNNPPVGVAPPPMTFPEFSIGKDTILCKGQTLSLAVKLCNAQYRWNTGSTGQEIKVSQGGVYWVDVTMQGKTVRKEITVSYYEPISVGLGADQAICPGSNVSWVLPLFPGATYRWSDGGTSHLKPVSGPGMYWVEVSNRCQAVRDTAMIEYKVPPVVELGSDIIVCKGDNIALNYLPAEDETLVWSTGTTDPTLSVTQSGVYKITVNNDCFESTDEIHVTIKDRSEIIVPNVVTDNHDGKNDRFLLPVDTDDFSLIICNRWGEKVFQTEKYENNWPDAPASSGVYFYIMRGDCVEGKGIIHLVR